MLTKEQRGLFVEEISRVYQKNVTEKQITNLVPDTFECTVRFSCEEDGKKQIHYFKGVVKNLRTFPYKCEFTLSDKQKESLMKAQRTGLKFDCQLSTKSKKSKQKILEIDGKDLIEMGLIDELFGTNNEIFVTRKQFASFTKKLNTLWRISDEYNITDNEFDSFFVQDLIKQTSEKMFETVMTDLVVKSFSKFSSIDIDSSDIVEWRLEGEQIVAKCIIAAKLIRSKFEQVLKFSRLRRETFEILFEKSFTLETLAENIKEEVKCIPIENELGKTIIQNDIIDDNDVKMKEMAQDQINKKESDYAADFEIENLALRVKKLNNELENLEKKTLNAAESTILIFLKYPLILRH